MIGTITTGRTTGAELHARATMLARQAMKAQAGTAGDNSATGSWAIEQMDYLRRQAVMRDEGIARGQAHNQELKEQGEIRRHGGYQRDLPF